MAENDGQPGLRQLWLEGIEVNFAGGRLNKKLELVIGIGETVFKHPLGEEEQVRWEGRRLCSKELKLTLDVQHPRSLPFRKPSQLAHFEVLLSTVDKSIITLSDTSHGADVKLTFTGAQDKDGKTNTARIGQYMREAKEKADEKQRGILNKLASAHDLIENIGNSVESLSSFLGPFNTALQYFIDACKTRQEAWEAASNLMEEFEMLLSITERVDILRERRESREALKSMLQLIATMTDYILNYAGTIADFLITQEYTAKIDDFRIKFKEAFKWFELCVTLEVFKGIHSLEHDSKLKELRPSLTAHYRTGEDRVCLKGTRANLLDDAMHWLRHFKSLPLDHQDAVEMRHEVLWLHGLAGSGKSSVANTIAAMVEQEEFYLSCFFCKRDDPELSDPTKVLPTLAYRIAQQHGGYRTALVDVLSRGSVGAGIITGDLHKQFKTLFEDLVTKVESPPRAHVIVIDALDECGKPNDQRQLSRYLLSLAGLVPWIKVFITSRPEPTITNILRPAPSCEARDINAEEYTTSDIRLYIQTKLESMAEMDEISPFNDDDINRLVDQAAGLFIWCATLFKYIANSWDKEGDLRQFLSGVAKTEPLQQLYALYDKVLDGAVDPEHRQKQTRLLRVILGLILITADNKPLSANALYVFLQSDTQYAVQNARLVRTATRSLHAVLYEDNASGDAIRVYHPSFLDFLRDRIESGVAGWVSIDQLQCLAFKSCFLTLNEELKFNICCLESSSSFNKNIQSLPETIAVHVSESLQYSSLFWFSHLKGITLKDDDEEVKASVSGFLKSTKVFFWLEVLSLLDVIGRGIMMLRESSEFFKDDPDISSAASDLERFVLSYSEAFKSTPHIYLSALAWLPERSQTLDMAKSSDSFSHLRMITDKEQHWEGARSVKSVNAEVLSVAYSPNGRYIAAGVEDGTVCIWDSRTSEAVHQPLNGHRTRVESVVFSPDNQLLASGSADGTIRIWSVATGAAVTTMGGDSGRILCVAFSPDGQRIASASYEIGVQIWDVNTGGMIGGPWFGDPVWSVAFSPDGERIVISSSHDGIASIQNARTGQPTGNLLKTEVGMVLSVAWSRNGGYVASGAHDALVRIWNARSGEGIGQALKLKGHTAAVRSVAFSPDSTQIVSSSDDGSIRLWDVTTGRELHMPLKDHGDQVWSVTFSPDGQSILSGSSDGTIRIWDVDTAATTDGPSQVHSDYDRVAFSPDGQYFASGSGDGRVCIWNAITGTARCEPFRVHLGSVDYIVFSPDSHSIVTVSGDTHDITMGVWDSRTGAKLIESIQVPGERVTSVGFCLDGRRIVSTLGSTVHVWDGETGVEIKALKGHSDFVLSTSLFPDGGRIVSGSWDETLRIWDINTGEMIGKPLTGHREIVTVVAVSPDGQHIASGSRDLDVRIWDAQTHGTIHVLQGHTGMIASISFSADGQYIVSGSYDRTLRIWNVETGKAVGNPLRGHNSKVNSVAFSPDGQRIVSCAWDGTIRMWDAQIGAATVKSSSTSTDEQNSDGECRYKHWNACCSGIEVTDGWVKDGDKLLLWIPLRYREHFKPQLHFSIPARQSEPEVDLACLYGYAGKQWTGMYKL